MGERFIQEAIESIFLQTYTNYEIIVVDDGSIDNTKQLVLKYPSIRYYYKAKADLTPLEFQDTQRTLPGYFKQALLV